MLLKGQTFLLIFSIALVFVLSPFVDHTPFWKFMGIFIPALMVTTAFTAYYQDQSGDCESMYLKTNKDRQ
jgi:hypothetical protein